MKIQGVFMRDLFFTIKFYSSNFFSRVRNFIIDAVEFTFYFTKAMFLFPFAKLGCVKAQLEIAEIVVSHNWQNYTKAIKKIIGDEVILGWIFTETLKNNIHALILAGDIYERKADDLHSSLRDGNSKNTEDDVKNLFKISLNYYKQASDLGSAFAQLNCYRLHDFYHYCVDLTEAQAKEFLFLSAKNNLPNGQFLYGEEMLKQDRFEEGLFYIEKSVKAKKRMWAKEIGSYGNRKKATQWYKKNKNLKDIVQNAFSGNAQAMFEYSEYLINDSHKNDSLKLAHKWHTKSARAGFPRAMAEEGYFIIHGWVDATLEDAFDYFQKAVNAGYKKAHYGVAECYLYGWGVEQNYEKAKYHFEKIGKGNILKGITAENIKEKIDGDRTLKNDREFYN